MNASSSVALAEALRAALLDGGWAHGSVPAAAPSPAPATLLLARDTRPSGHLLAAAAAAGAASLGATVMDFGAHCTAVDTPISRLFPPALAGELTTPALHLAVYDSARGVVRPNGAAAFEAHVGRLAAGYAQMVVRCPVPEPDAQPLLVDCANGVGAMAAAALAAHPVAAGAGLRLRLVNASRAGLNHACGADYVQKARAPPCGVGAPDQIPYDQRCCSLDGDADRLVYWRAEGPQQPFALLDGDRTACLVACHVCGLLAQAQLALSLAVVQTPYANGASAAFLRARLGDRVHLVQACTGVKHLHAAAVSYDVSLYWEANGHGAVLFSDAARAAVTAACASEDARAAVAAQQLAAVDTMSNPAVGDGLSALLLVEAVLRATRTNIPRWLSLYADLPSCHLALRVRDRRALRTAAGDEQTVVEPAGLQLRIAHLVAQAGPSARAFARASGTEDLVRVFAEAHTQEGAQELARAVARAVHEMADGTGDAP